MHFYCGDCKKKYPINTKNWKCSCGGVFHLFHEKNEEMANTVTIGGGITPLLPFTIGRLDFLLKLENLQPTGTVKDRGAYTLINEYRKFGITKLITDTMGDAGASFAAYAAAAGMDITCYMAENASKIKEAQIRAYGAHVFKVKGGWRDACKAAQMAAEGNPDARYISYVYNPLFYEGMRSLAMEITDQVGDVPEYIVLPVKNGSLLLGLYYAFADIGRLPHFLAVEEERCAPLYAAMKGLPAPSEPDTALSQGDIDAKGTEQSGLAGASNSQFFDPKPPRLEQMKKAIERSGGDVVMVGGKARREAQRILGGRGIYVEPISAMVLAGAIKFFQDGKPDNYRVVLPLTGSGLNR